MLLIIKYAHSVFFSSRTQSHSCKSTSKAKSAVGASKLSPPESGILQHGNGPRKKMKRRAQPQHSQMIHSSPSKPCSEGSQTSFSSSIRRRTTRRHSSLTRTGCGNCARPFKILSILRLHGTYLSHMSTLRSGISRLVTRLIPLSAHGFGRSWRMS